jgi:SAM-dependent methyltransferase
MSIRNDIHTDKGLNIYAQGMSNSAPDKARIVEHIQPGSVLEIGCGNGVVLKLAADQLKPDGSKPWVGVDMNAKLLSMAAKDLEGWPVTLLRADMRRRESFLNTLRPYGGFDNIIFSSTLHEIYSEEFMAQLNGPRTGAERTDTKDEQTAEHMAWGAIMVAINMARKLLAPGGRIIIRDGIQPAPEQLKVKFQTEFGETQFYKFVDDYPRFIHYREFSHSHGTVYVDAVDLFEFMTKYFYLENWEVEVNEVFGWTSEEQFKVQFQGSSLQHFEAYTIPWLADKWAGDFEVKSIIDEPYCFPSTFLAVIGGY